MKISSNTMAGHSKLIIAAASISYCSLQTYLLALEDYGLAAATTLLYVIGIGGQYPCILKKNVEPPQYMATFDFTTTIHAPTVTFRIISHRLQRILIEGRKKSMNANNEASIKRYAPWRFVLPESSTWSIYLTFRCVVIIASYSHTL